MWAGRGEDQYPGQNWPCGRFGQGRREGYFMARQRSTHTQSALQTHAITSVHNWSRKSGVRTQQLISTARKVMGSLAGRDPGLPAPPNKHPRMPHSPSQTLVSHSPPFRIHFCFLCLGSRSSEKSRRLVGEAEQTGTGRSRLGQRSPGFLKPWF